LRLYGVYDEKFAVFISSSSTSSKGHSNRHSVEAGT
jgi:hypothetical protein